MLYTSIIHKSNMPLRIMFIIENHLRLLVNWMRDGRLGILSFAVLFILYSIIGVMVFLIESNSSLLNLYLLSLLLIYLPTKATKYYLGTTIRDEELLKYEYSDNEIKKIRLLQTIVSNTILYNMLFSLVCLIDYSKRASFHHYIIIYIIILAISSVQAYIVRNRQSSKIIKKYSGHIWDVNIKNNGHLPIRGVIARTYLYFLRTNRLFVIKYALISIPINAFSVLFIVNNNKYEYAPAVIILQMLYLIFNLVDMPNKDNVKLLSDEPGFALPVLIGEYLFMAVFFSTYVISLFVLYSVFAITMTWYNMLLIIVMMNVLLFYVITLRISYLNDSAYRTFMLLISFTIIPLPYLIFKSYRRIKCLTF